MSANSSPEDLRSLFIGYPIAMMATSVFCYVVSRKVPRSSQKVLHQVTKLVSATDLTEETSKQFNTMMQGKKMALPLQANPSQLLGKHYTRVDVVKVYVLVVAVILQLYFYYSFTRHVLDFASWDFTAKVIGILWILVGALMPLSCLGLMGSATQVPEYRGLLKPTFEPSKCADSELVLPNSSELEVSNEVVADPRDLNSLHTNNEPKLEPFELDPNPSLSVSHEFLTWIIAIGFISIFLPLIELAFA